MVFVCWGHGVADCMAQFRRRRPRPKHYSLELGLGYTVLDFLTGPDYRKSITYPAPLPILKARIVL